MGILDKLFGGQSKSREKITQTIVTDKLKNFHYQKGFEDGCYQALEKTESVTQEEEIALCNYLVKHNLEIIYAPLHGLLIRRLRRR